MLQAAIHEWRATPPGHGNDNFFLLALALRSAGLDAGQIAATLESEAKFGRSPNERKAQIRCIMDGLFQTKTK
jgi:hypothetical protein